MTRERIRTIGNLILVLIGMVVLGYYLTCEDSCAYLQGTILGLDLKYVGFIFLSAMGVLALLRQWPYLRAFLAAALGVELFLIGFQIREDVYCPYCLAIAAIVLIAFIVNYERPERMHGMSFLGMVQFPWPARLGPIPLSVFVLAGFLFVWLTFSGSVLPVYGAEGPGSVPTFGNGSDEVRIYADYFCPPCGGVEPVIEQALGRLARGDAYRVTFVDVPFHRETVVYATQFLYIVNAGADIDTILRARHVLFREAQKNVRDEAALKSALTANGIPTRPYDTALTFKALNLLIKEDAVTDTPSCVIVTGGKKAKYVGFNAVKNAVNGLVNR